MDLHLIPTHPDRCAGLAFLGQAPKCCRLTQIDQISVTSHNRTSEPG
jgi:hypothetical protein